MTTFLQARNDIQALFLAAWGDRTPVALDNENYPPPGVAVEPSWVRLTVLHEAGGQETMGGPGNRKFQRDGRAIVSIFVPVDKGAAGADGHVDAAALALESKTTTNHVHLHGGHATSVGPDGRWWQVNFEVIFSFFEVK